jgi:hypothetical protein
MRLVALLGIVLVTESCSDPTSNVLQPGDLVGDYRLVAANDADLPYNSNGVTVTAGMMFVRADGTLFYDLGGFFPNPAFPGSSSAWVTSSNGTWAPTSDGIAITGTPMKTAILKDSTMTGTHVSNSWAGTVRLTYRRVP